MTTEMKEGLLDFLEAMTQAFHLLDAGEKSFIVNRGNIEIRYNLNPEDEVKKAADNAIRKIEDVLVDVSFTPDVENEHLGRIARAVGEYLAVKDGEKHEHES